MRQRKAHAETRTTAASTAARIRATGCSLLLVPAIVLSGCGSSGTSSGGGKTAAAAAAPPKIARCLAMWNDSTNEAYNTAEGLPGKFRYSVSIDAHGRCVVVGEDIKNGVASPFRQAVGKDAAAGPYTSAGPLLRASSLPASEQVWNAVVACCTGPGSPQLGSRLTYKPGA